MNVTFDPSTAYRIPVSQTGIPESLAVNDLPTESYRKDILRSSSSSPALDEFVSHTEQGMIAGARFEGMTWRDVLKSRSYDMKNFREDLRAYREHKITDPEKLHKIANLVDMALTELGGEGGAAGILDSDKPRYMLEYVVAAQGKVSGVNHEDNPLVVVMEEIVIPKLRDKSSGSYTKGSEFWGGKEDDLAHFDWEQKMAQDSEFAQSLGSVARSVLEANHGSEEFDPDSIRNKAWEEFAKKPDSVSGDFRNELEEVKKITDEKGAAKLIKKALMRDGLGMQASDIISLYISTWNQEHVGQEAENPFEKVLIENLDKFRSYSEDKEYTPTLKGLFKPGPLGVRPLDVHEYQDGLLARIQDSGEFTNSKRRYDSGYKVPVKDRPPKPREKSGDAELSNHSTRKERSFWEVWNQIWSTPLPGLVH